MIFVSGWLIYWQASVNIWAKSNVTFDIGLHRVGAPAGCLSGIRYVITKFSCVHRFPVSFSNGAPPPARKTPDSTKKLTWHLRVKIPELHPGKGQIRYTPRTNDGQMPVVYRGMWSFESIGALLLRTLRLDRFDWKSLSMYISFWRSCWTNCRRQNVRCRYF